MLFLLDEKTDQDDDPNMWPEMSYNRSENEVGFEEYDVEENDELYYMTTGMEIYFLSAYFDGSEIIILSELNIEEELNENGFHLVSDEEINKNY